MNALLTILDPHLRTPSAHELPRHVLNIGLTGGIGSGKSTVAQMLAAHGCAVLDMDQISHTLTQAGGAALPAISAHFGAQALVADGALDRAYIRARVFENPAERAALEGILHPLIAQTVVARAHELAESFPYLIYDIPLLAESSTWQQRLDWIVVVDCLVETQVTRVHARSPQLSETQIRAIIAAQASPQQRLSIANAVIDNRENTANRLNLWRQVAILVNHIRAIGQKNT